MKCCYEKRKKLFSLFLATAIGICGAASVCAREEPYLIEKEILPLSDHENFVFGGCGPSYLTDSDQITMYMQDNDLTIDEKLEFVRQQISFLEPSIQCELIQDSDLSGAEKDLLISECVYTQEEYDLVINMPSPSASATWYSLPGTFTCYKQETINFCMPATAQNAIYYLTGSLVSQDDLADEMDIVKGFVEGNFDNLKPCVNKYQSARIYIQRSNITQIKLLSCFYADITSYYCPTLVRIYNPKGQSNWDYTTDGHALCVVSLNSDRDLIKVADSDVGTS